MGFESRQVIDIDFSRVVTEYQAQVLEDRQENRFVVAFPEGVNRAVQYGLHLKANAVYRSQFQRIPYDRIRDHFEDQMSIPISAGSVFRFNQEAYGQLEAFGQWAKTRLAKADLLQVDETGINVADRYRKSGRAGRWPVGAGGGRSVAPALSGAAPKGRD